MITITLCIWDSSLDRRIQFTSGYVEGFLQAILTLALIDHGQPRPTAVVPSLPPIQSLRPLLVYLMSTASWNGPQTTEGNMVFSQQLPPPPFPSLPPDATRDSSIPGVSSLEGQRDTATHVPPKYE